MSIVRRGPPSAHVKTEDRALVGTTESERRFAALCERLFRRLCDYASLALGRADAEDLVQDTLYRIWDRWPVIAVDNPGPTYFFQAVRNAVIDAVHERDHADAVARVLDIEIEDLEGGAAPDAQLEAKERARIIDAAVARMPARCREAWVLIRDNDYSYREAAQIMGLEHQSAKNTMTRASRYVREAMTDAGYLEAARKQRSLPSSTEGNQS